MNAQRINELAEAALVAIAASPKSIVHFCRGKYIEVRIEDRNCGFRKVIGAIRFEIWRSEDALYADIYELPSDLQDLALDLLSSFKE